MFVLRRNAGTNVPLNNGKKTHGEYHIMEFLKYWQGEVWYFMASNIMICKQVNYGLHVFSNMVAKYKRQTQLQMQSKKRLKNYNRIGKLLHLFGF